MNGFVGIVDLETINKMAVFFNYRWESRGWMNYPIENPLYKIRPYKNKKEGAILIARL